MTSKYNPPTTPARTTRGSPRPTIVKSMVEKSPISVNVLTRERRSRISGIEKLAFSAPIPLALWRMYSSRSSSLLTSGRSRTPRTTLEMAALAPIPSASVTMTVIASPFTLSSDRTANRKSVMKVIGSYPACAC